MKNGKKIFACQRNPFIFWYFGPFITKNNTTFRKPVSVEKQVAVTLYYLADGGRMRKIANAFGLGKATVSKHGIVTF